MCVFFLFSVPKQRFLFHWFKISETLPFRLKVSLLRVSKPSEESGQGHSELITISQDEIREHSLKLERAGLGANIRFKF